MCVFIIVSYLEWFERILVALEHTADGRLLLVFGDGVGGLEDFDGRRDARHFCGADEVATHANTGFKEIGVVLNLLRPLQHWGLVVICI